MVWNDAYLAAFAKAGKYEVVTFDKAFAQFPGIRYTILS
jgi:predicted nucleic acid-binding protein